MVEEHLDHRRRQRQQCRAIAADRLQHESGIELPHDGDRDAVVQALERDADREEMEVRQGVDKDVVVVPAVRGLEMFAEAHAIEAAMREDHALRLSRRSRRVELDRAVFLADRDARTFGRHRRESRLDRVRIVEPDRLRLDDAPRDRRAPQFFELALDEDDARATVRDELREPARR